MKRCLWLPMFILVLCLPDIARADGITPLMFAGLLHMTLGNALIGTVEGLLIAWIFRLRMRACIPAMILANYFSAWIGGMPIVKSAQAYLHLDINNALQWMLVLLVITYVATLILEWPFVAFCFGRSPGWLSRSLRANLLVQTVSYLGLVAWYASAGHMSLFTDIHVVPASQMAVPPGSVVYYIDAGDGDVYRQDLPAGFAQKVVLLRSASPRDYLFVRESQLDPGRWDLFARCDWTDSGPGREVLVKRSFASRSELPAGRDENDASFEERWRDPSVLRLGDATRSRWDFDRYYMDGLRATPRYEGTPARLAVKTLLIDWDPWNPVQLPSDHVVFQFGEHQICILDPQIRQVALIVHGYGQIVVLQDAPAVSGAHDQDLGKGRTSPLERSE